jgi:hypothetical protein
LPFVENVELDAPPAGTPCAICEDIGHFCPAKRWQENSDKPLCLACFEEQDCDVLKAIERIGKDFGVTEDDVRQKNSAARSVPRSEWRPEDFVIKEQPVRREDVPFGLRKEFAPAKIDRPKKEVKLVETAIAKQGSILPPNPRIGDAKDMVQALGKILAGVANGSIKPDQANAACNVAMAMLKCVELDHKINGGKRSP